MIKSGAARRGFARQHLPFVIDGHALVRVHPYIAMLFAGERLAHVDDLLQTAALTTHWVGVGGVEGESSAGIKSHNRAI